MVMQCGAEVSLRFQLAIRKNKKKDGTYFCLSNLSVVPAASQRATWGLSKKTTESGSLTDTPIGGQVMAPESSKLLATEP